MFSDPERPRLQKAVVTAHSTVIHPCSVSNGREWSCRAVKLTVALGAVHRRKSQWCSRRQPSDQVRTGVEAVVSAGLNIALLLMEASHSRTVSGCYLFLSLKQIDVYMGACQME